MAKKDTGKKDHIVAQAAPSSDLVGYQKGAIVSREIIRRKTGTVTLFAFDRGQGLSEHTAPFDALVHILDGEAEITISGVPQKVRKDDLIILPAGKPHALQATRRFKMLLTMIRSGE
ncbi:MAG: cupin domain-containing protein [Euryarchaeota archaeon]|nr:cupin domain-containing protein [Euryarchaeota archaeon]